ncbi:hypothetical protein SERLA73DRAFT_185334 [Serpula lacrymans var. lacrymans S7.3]|uniref:DNA polymerase delta subunit 4 n=2 Tax=Serpula lacrymans var. lacrymans TaxID=341189 RepID=F8Q4I6_SERL3|nr:uncharacterized protein SERLADRAFT_473725 [Serpula lacrymans var. lacrymans S7.9]EGN97041.1 hypothetical protein SERLA73DRAFT_185334 [Serpula lacrymans var. lacrymans S7.3]EGO22626.1 hypothetical protein SERLADRAFT_473725 [Serpula lacrymans var. lacrymans S7.9]
MAPSKRSASSLNKKTKSTNSTPMKQASLSFSSAKRTNSNISTQGNKPLKRSSSLVHRKSEGEEGAGSEDIIEVSSEDDHGITAKKVRVSLRKSDARGTWVKQGSPVTSVVIKKEALDPNDKAGRWRKHYDAVRGKMDNMEPIHSAGQTKVHEILRVFDMSYEYGPCVGMSRLERWERADVHGLSPPIEVREILSTKEGMENDEFSQCVLYGEV